MCVVFTCAKLTKRVTLLYACRKKNKVLNAKNEPTWQPTRILLEHLRDNGKEHGNYYIKGLHRESMGLYRLMVLSSRWFASTQRVPMRCFPLLTPRSA